MINQSMLSFQNDLAAYQNLVNHDAACFVQDEAISKDAKRLSIDKSTCIMANTTNLWFGFESKTG
jgi:hypothetical protein